MATTCSDYEFTSIEPHWQAWWEENRCFQTPDDSDKPKFYLLDMFPYPSGAGLHMGHTENYAATDILGRYKVARGFNVLHPMGWDAFGLPAEQYALKTGTHPAITTQTNVDNFRRQLKRTGLGLDFSREVNTTDPSYYKWTQWIFMLLFKHGLAYVDERPVNWCPELGTVLANEEVIDGKSDVGGHPVERRNLRQWVLRITAYADRLLKGLEGLDWPESTKTQQANWIGRSEGAEVHFKIAGRQEEELVVFTTRPDTLFGATYMVVSPEHPLVPSLTTLDQKEKVEAYVAQAASKSDLDRTELAKEKTGVFTGAYAINPVNGQDIPIWVADYVLMTYGTGAIMAVPGHDDRDFEFAQKFQIPIQRVVEKERGTTNGGVEGLPYTGPGFMVHSGDYTGMDNATCKTKITADLQAKDEGKQTVHFKLRDWLFSRQRYWGEPFPIVWVCETVYEKAKALGGEVAAWMPKEPIFLETDEGNRMFALPIPPSQLPVILPETDNFKPSGEAESPLANVTDWVNCRINLETGEVISEAGPSPETGEWAPGRRETNTMPQWAGSCWYYLRFLDPHNTEAMVGEKNEQYWGVPDLYMGGAEHAVLHLLYARFWHLFLYDQGILTTEEPFKKLFHHGVILGEDGEKMSKSRGNIASPDEFFESHGADAIRLYLMFMGPLDKKKPWNSKNIEGISRFLQKIWREFIDRDGQLNSKIVDRNQEMEATDRLLHQTIEKVTHDTETLGFNTAISQLMIMVNQLAKSESYTRETAKTFLQMLAPYAPHLAEELWERLGEAPSIMNAGWPEADPAKLVQNTVEIVFQVNGKVRSQAVVHKDADKADLIAMAKTDPKVQGFIEGKSIKKEIVVPNKLVNLVAV